MPNLTETDKLILLGALGTPETTNRVTQLLELAGTGNVTGPATSTDNALVRFDGLTGALLQNSSVLLSDAGALTATQTTTPSNPAAGSNTFYFKSDNRLYTLTSAGVESLAGDLSGPASSTDNAITRFDLTTGKLVQNSTVTIADTSGAMQFTAASGANITWATDGAGDIGADTNNRPNRIFAKTQTQIGTNPFPGFALTPFSVNSDSTTVSFPLVAWQEFIGAGGVFNTLMVRTGRGTDAAPTAIGTNDSLFNISVRGYHSGAAFGGSVGTIRFTATENYTSTAQGVRLGLYTTATGSTTLTERLRVDHNGPVFLMTSSGANLLWNTDGAGTIGASGANRPSSIFYTSQLRSPNGTAGAPSLSFAADATFGFYAVDATNLGLSIGGTERFRWSSNSFQFQGASSANLLWGTDGAGNIGATGATRPNNIFAAGNLVAEVAGKGLNIKEGTNARMGVSTLVAGTVTVSTTSVTANSRIFLTGQDSSGVVGELTISARNAGVDFTITSASAADTRSVAWMIVEPA